MDRAILSIDRQSLIPDELILVDDASPDETRDVLHRIAAEPRSYVVRVVELSRNCGPAAARNAGWDAANPAATHIAFLDADDEWTPTKLAGQVAWMGRNPHVAWSAHLCAWPSRPVPQPSSRRSDDSTPLTARRILLRNPIATPTVMARRNIGCRFRDDWRHCEDLMLWLDWLDAGYPAALIHETWCILGRRPTTSGGLTGDREAMYAGERRVLDKLVAEGRMAAWERWVWGLHAAARFAWRRLLR